MEREIRAWGCSLVSACGHESRLWRHRLLRRQQTEVRWPIGLHYVVVGTGRRRLSSDLRVNIDVLRPHELDAADAARWREIQASRPELANPFLCPGSPAPCARSSRRLRWRACARPGAIVGYFAFERGRWGMGRPIGAGVSDAQGVVGEPGMEWDARALLAAVGWG